MSALLAKAIAFSKVADKRQKDLKTINQKLITRCSNSLNRYREFSAPEIMTYIMGWGDVYESHQYVAIFWDPIERALKQVFPELVAPSAIQYEQREGQDESAATVRVEDGKVTLKDQLQDYRFRGSELHGMSFLDFMLSTYEGKEKAENTSGLGRIPNQRVRYSAEANKNNKTRVIRTHGHETLPRFVGKWFPRNDGEHEHQHEFYYASMLALLEPWTDLKNLKGSSTFADAFERMVEKGDRRTHNVIHNIQYYFECQDGAKARIEEERKIGTLIPTRSEIAIDEGTLEVDIEDHDEDDNTYMGSEVTEEMLEKEKQMKERGNEMIFGRNAVYEAYDHGIFTEADPDTVWKECAPVSTDDEMLQILAWEKRLKDSTRKMVNINLEMQESQVQPSIVEGTATAQQKRYTPTIMQTSNKNVDNARPKLAMLNEEQKRAHDIIEQRLKEHLES